MRELIAATYAKWQKVSKQVQKHLIKAGEHTLAKKYADCQVFKGTETIEQLIQDVFLSFQGLEFLVRHNFPDLETLRLFKKYHPERWGVYIDCGRIDISEPRTIVLVGNTNASLKCAETAKNRIVLKYGATAIVEAKGFSVTRIEKDNDSHVVVKKHDHAIVV